MDPLELLLADHLLYLECPVPVDTGDPEDCANVAVEVVRFLRESGVINDDGLTEQARLSIEAIEAEMATDAEEAGLSRAARRKRKQGN